MWSFITLILTLNTLLAILLIETWYEKKKCFAIKTGENFVKDGSFYVSTADSMVRQQFTVIKKANSLRVFILGGSAAMGTPYVHQGLNRVCSFFSRLLTVNKGGIATWIKEYLENIYPDKKIEVINAAKGGHALASSIKTLKEIVSIGKPDLIIILSGNNERAQDDSCLEKITTITRKFKKGLAQIITIAQTEKIKIYLLTVPSNIRDWLPTAEADLKLEEALSLIKKEEYSQALSLLKETELKKNALNLYYIAKCYDGLKNYEKARTYYLLARDLDESFIRCRAPLNKAIKEVKENYVKVIDLEEILFTYAKDGLPGNDLFHDYCHFKLQTNKIIAYEIIRYYLKENQAANQTLAALKDIKLTPIISKQLKILYFLKMLKWLRYKYYSPSKTIRELNANEVIRNYKTELNIAGQQIDFLKKVNEN